MEHSDEDQWEIEGLQMLIRPKLCDTQLIGDNFFFEFAKDELKSRCQQFEGLQYRSGLCVSGMTIRECCVQSLMEQVIHPKVVILIGAIDVLMGKTFDHMKGDMTLLINTLHTLGVKKAVVCTIPPLFTSTVEQKDVQLVFNSWLVTSAAENVADFGMNVNCLDIFDMFHTSDNASQYYNKSPINVDLGSSILTLVVWNEEGCAQVKRVLEVYLGR